ncbi:MAG: hypothetical protein AAGF13_05585 [Pseudomonadota bacterium]
MRLFATSALAALPLSGLGAPAFAQSETPAWIDALGLNSIVKLFVQTGITAGRSQADIIYGSLTVRGGGQFITLTDLKFIRFSRRILGGAFAADP